MNRYLCLLGLLLFLRIGFVAAEEADQAPLPADPNRQNRRGASLEGMIPGFRDRAVVLDINTRVIEQNKQEIWHEAHERITIPGRPVEIKIVGSNVIVAAQFIPHLKRRGQHILVAQGQIWIEIPNQGIRYQTTMQTIPLKFNEPVYYFPLGSSAHADDASIEIMLTMRPYRNRGTSEVNETENTENASIQGSSPP